MHIVKQGIDKNRNHDFPNVVGGSEINIEADLERALLEPNTWMKFKEVCGFLSISKSTGYDWRDEKSPRYKSEFAELATYLTNRSVRFSKHALVRWILNQSEEVKNERV